MLCLRVSDFKTAFLFFSYTNVLLHTVAAFLQAQWLKIIFKKNCIKIVQLREEFLRGTLLAY